MCLVSVLQFFFLNRGLLPSMRMKKKKKETHVKSKADLLGALQLPAQTSVVHFADRAAKAAVKTWQRPIFNTTRNVCSFLNHALHKKNG